MEKVCCGFDGRKANDSTQIVCWSYWEYLLFYKLGFLSLSHTFSWHFHRRGNTRLGFKEAFLSGLSLLPQVNITSSHLHWRVNRKLRDQKEFQASRETNSFTAAFLLNPSREERSQHVKQDKDYSPFSSCLCTFESFLLKWKYFLSRHVSIRTTLKMCICLQ